MTELTSVIQQIKDQIWSGDTPDYITQHEQFDQRAFDELIYEKTWQHLALNYLINMMQREDVTKEQFEELLQIAKTREGVQNIAAAIMLNSEYDPEIVKRYEHAKRIKDS